MSLEMTGSFAICGKCDRKILVERALIGVDHTAATIVSCWDCLDAETQQKAYGLYPGIEKSLKRQQERDRKFRQAEDTRNEILQREEP